MYCLCCEHKLFPNDGQFGRNKYERVNEWGQTKIWTVVMPTKKQFLAEKNYNLLTSLH